MLCFHSPCLAHLIPARQCSFLSLLISAPASSALIQLVLPSSMCAWVWGEYKWNNSWMKGQTGVFNNTDQQEGWREEEKPTGRGGCSRAMKSGKLQRDGKATQNKVRGWLLPDYEQKEQREWEQMALNCITP